MPTATLSADEAGIEQTTMRRVMRRVIPFIFICYVVSYLDRINIGFAALQMNQELGLTPTTFGWAAGLFFIGYFVCELPSNLAMQRVGARRWIARIMISWGLVSAATALVTGPVSFSIMRFLLGMAEAGFTPGIYLFFTLWFPGQWRARATAAFLVGIPVANMIGSPISGALLTLHGLGGVAGWQWLLLIEGVPAVILGVACLFVLADEPKDAAWLPPEQRSWLQQRLSDEKISMAAKHGSSLRAAFANPALFVLAFINFCGICGSLGVGIWLPQIVKEFGLSNLATGFVAAIPYVAGAACMVIWARMAAKSSQRIWYVSGALAAAAVGLAASAVAATSVTAMLALTLTVVGILAFQASFWAIPSDFLTGRAAAAGLALMVSIGNLGGFVGPFLIGYLRESTNGFTAPLLSIAAVLLVGAIAMRLVGDPGKPGERNRAADVDQPA